MFGGLIDLSKLEWELGMGTGIWIWMDEVDEWKKDRRKKRKGQLLNTKPGKKEKKSSCIGIVDLFDLFGRHVLSCSS